MLLATTGQTTDGFVHANFGSPMGIFGAAPDDSQTGVMAIGDGSSDATELASLLSVTGTTTAKPGPLRVAFETGGPNASELKVFPTTGPAAARISDQSLVLPSKPVVDAQGRIDCSGSVSCQTDPATNITTVTYPDGIVALVQKINDTTVIAYKTLTDALPAPLQNLLPSAPASASSAAAAAAPVADAAAAAPVADAPVADAAAAAAPVAADPSVAPLPDISAATIRPRVTVSSPPLDYTPGPGKTGGVFGNPLQLPTNTTNPVDIVKDAVNSVVNAIGGVVNNALKPGNHSSSRTKAPAAPSAPAN